LLNRTEQWRANVIADAAQPESANSQLTQIMLSLEDSNE